MRNFEKIMKRFKEMPFSEEQKKNFYYEKTLDHVKSELSEAIKNKDLFAIHHWKETLIEMTKKDTIKINGRDTGIGEFERVDVFTSKDPTIRKIMKKYWE